MRKTIILINILLIASLGCHSYSTPKSTFQKPYNVLFLIVDDMNDYGFYKQYPGIKTPYLDAFKKSAVTFRHAYCASPVCTPSRAATFSGLYPHTTGAYFNGSDPWRKSDTLQHIETLPELYKRNGYTTFGMGKLYHAKLEEGRDEKNWDNNHYGGGFGPFPDSSHQIKGRFWGIQAFPDSLFPDVRNTDAAIDFLQQAQERPFFLALGLWRPHTPFTAPQRFFDQYNEADMPLPKGYVDKDIEDIAPLAHNLLDKFGRFNPSDMEEWKALLKAYAACTSFADWNIGRILEALDNSPYADNTIVVFWSDNGYHCGEKDHWEKGTLWEQAALTPTAIRIPGNSNNGRVCTQPISLIDLYPTLVDYCALNKPSQQLEGLSLKPLLQDFNTDWPRPALTSLGIEYTSLRTERYRYIRFSDGKEELYDHQNDPYEWNNLAGFRTSQSIIESFQPFIPKAWAPELNGRRF